MSVYVGYVRTPSMRLRHSKFGGVYPANLCELCLKPVKPGAEHMVAIDHNAYEFVTEKEAIERGDAVSLFPVGRDCERRIKTALSAS